MASDPPSDRPLDGTRVRIVGAGAVGGAVAFNLADRGARVEAWSRTEEGRVAARGRLAPVAERCAVVDDWEALGESDDPVLVAVPDDALEHVARELAPRLSFGTCVLHTSGYHGREVLAACAEAGARTGSLHPALPLTRRAEPFGPSDRFAGGWFAVEGDEAALAWAARWIDAWGARSFRLEPGTKPAYHALCSLVAGGSVALVGTALTELLRLGAEEEAARGVLLGLFERSAANLARSSPAAALTGPVVRGDAGVVAGHVRALDGDARELYRAAARAMVAVARAGGRVSAEVLARMEAALDPDAQGD